MFQPDEQTRTQLLSDAQPQNYKVNEYLDPGKGAERGPSIIDIGGDVVGGNRSLLRMAKYLDLIKNDSIALNEFQSSVRAFAQQTVCRFRWEMNSTFL